MAFYILLMFISIWDFRPTTLDLIQKRQLLAERHKVYWQSCLPSLLLCNAILFLYCLQLCLQCCIVFGIFSIAYCPFSMVEMFIVSKQRIILEFFSSVKCAYHEL